MREVSARWSVFGAARRWTAPNAPAQPRTPLDAGGQWRLASQVVFIAAVLAAQQHHDPLELLTIRQVTQLLKFSRTKIYTEIAAGRLHTVKLGRTTRIPRAELERYIEDGGR